MKKKKVFQTLIIAFLATAGVGIMSFKRSPKIYKIVNGKKVFDPQTYWNDIRYVTGGAESGTADSSELTLFKASVLDTIKSQYNFKSVVDLGCGEGKQIQHYKKYLNGVNYTGVDFAENAINLCKKRFAADTNLKFTNLGEFRPQKADLVISSDVIFHLIGEKALMDHINLILACNPEYIYIRSSDVENADFVNKNGTKGWRGSIHVEHHRVTPFFEKKGYKIEKLILDPVSYKDGGSFSKNIILRKKH